MVALGLLLAENKQFSAPEEATKYAINLVLEESDQYLACESCNLGGVYPFKGDKERVSLTKLRLMDG